MIKVEKVKNLSYLKFNKKSLKLKEKDKTKIMLKMMQGATPLKYLK